MYEVGIDMNAIEHLTTCGDVCDRWLVVDKIWESHVMIIMQQNTE